MQISRQQKHHVLDAMTYHVEGSCRLLRSLAKARYGGCLWLVMFVQSGMQHEHNMIQASVAAERTLTLKQVILHLMADKMQLNQCIRLAWDA